MASKDDIATSPELEKSIDELVRMGCEFVVEGEVFKATIDLFDTLLTQEGADASGLKFLFELRALLLKTSRPVKANLRERPLIVTSSR